MSCHRFAVALLLYRTLCQQHSERRAESDSSEMIIVAHQAPSGDEHPNACPGSATEKVQSQVIHQAPSGDEHPDPCPGSATEKAQSQVIHQGPSGDEHPNACPGSATEKAQSQVIHQAPSGDEHPDPCPGSATEKAQSQVIHQGPSGDEHPNPCPGSATEKAQSQVTHETPLGDEHVNFGRKFDILASDSTCNDQSPSQPPSTTHHRRKIFIGKGNVHKRKSFTDSNFSRQVIRNFYANDTREVLVNDTNLTFRSFLYNCSTFRLSDPYKAMLY